MDLALRQHLVLFNQRMLLGGSARRAARHIECVNSSSGGSSEHTALASRVGQARGQNLVDGKVILLGGKRLLARTHSSCGVGQEHAIAKAKKEAINKKMFSWTERKIIKKKTKKHIFSKKLQTNNLIFLTPSNSYRNGGKIINY
jgi:hypothetical protein